MASSDSCHPRASTIRTVKLPQDRPRTFAVKIQSFHGPSTALALPSNPVIIVYTSDTRSTQQTLSPGDLLLHASDLSVWGSFAEIQEQLIWIAKQPYENKIVIAGHHDLLYENEF